MIEPDLRKRILAQPDRVLEDRDVMNALVSANESAMGSNIVDLRGIAMQRLETRLDRLEDTHRSVIAAAYENLAGTNQVHRAILQLLDPSTFAGFMQVLSTEVAPTLRVDVIRLVLETDEDDRPTDSTLSGLGEVLHLAPRGFVSDYITNGRNGPARPVVLRATTALAATLYGPDAKTIRSEALMKLNLSHDHPPAMLVFGAEDRTQFRSTHGTDLLVFFSEVFERLLRKWLE